MEKSCKKLSLSGLNEFVMLEEEPVFLIKKFSSDMTVF